MECISIEIERALPPPGSGCGSRSGSAGGGTSRGPPSWGRSRGGDFYQGGTKMEQEGKGPIDLGVENSLKFMLQAI